MSVALFIFMAAAAVRTARGDAHIIQMIVEDNRVALRQFAFHYDDLLHQYTHIGYGMLHVAARLGRVECAEIMVDAGADLNAHQKGTNVTPLVAAVNARMTEMVKYLLECDADTTIGTPLEDAVELNEGKIVLLLLAANNKLPMERALHKACMYGCTEAAKVLIALGPDLDAVDWCGYTSLHLAVISRSERIVRYLLAVEADLTTVDNEGNTLLHLSVYKEDWLTMLLLKQGVEVNQRNKYGETALFLATKNSLYETVRLLLAYEAMDLPSNKDGRTALMEAMYRNNVPMTMLLIAAGFDGTATDIGGRCLLHFAAAMHSSVLLGALLPERNVPLGVRDNDGYSPLHYSVRGNLENVIMLVMSGYDPNFRDMRNRTPLHVAASYNEEAAALVLVAEGAYVDAEDITGETPLQRAVKKGHTDTCMILVANGADVMRGNLVQVAVEQNYLGIVRILIAAGAPIDTVTSGSTPLLQAVKNGFEEVARVLIEGGANVNAVEKPMSETALMKCKKLPTLKYLLAFGANANAVSSAGMTALHHAVTYADNDIVFELLIHGGDPNFKSRLGMTPLHSATFFGNSQQVAMILAAGGDVHILNKDDKSPLLLAVERKNVESARLLMVAGSDLNAESRAGKTPLYTCITTQQRSIMLDLMEYGARIRSEDLQTYASDVYFTYQQQALKKQLPFGKYVKLGVKTFINNRATEEEQSWCQHPGPHFFGKAQVYAKYDAHVLFYFIFSYYPTWAKKATKPKKWVKKLAEQRMAELKEKMDNFETKRNFNFYISQIEKQLSEDTSLTPMTPRRIRHMARILCMAVRKNPDGVAKFQMEFTSNTIKSLDLIMK